MKVFGQVVITMCNEIFGHQILLDHLLRSLNYAEGHARRCHSNQVLYIARQAGILDAKSWGNNRKPSKIELARKKSKCLNVAKLIKERSLESLSARRIW